MLVRATHMPVNGVCAVIGYDGRQSVSARYGSDTSTFQHASTPAPSNGSVGPGKQNASHDFQVLRTDDLSIMMADGHESYLVNSGNAICTLLPNLRPCGLNRSRQAKGDLSASPD